MVNIQNINSLTPKPSQEWLRLSNEQQLDIIRGVEALHKRWQPNRWAARYYFISVEGVEVTLASKMRENPGIKGEHLRNIELFFRERSGEPLEIYCEAQDDANKPRSPEQRQKIKTWLQSRVNMKQRTDDEK